ncbi:MAG: TonB-dependent siderophore receptor, partial [Pseudacidovorax sp.]|nr:TonB-dependent siderophore receptor [Pseudacidovorax sp.]
RELVWEMGSHDRRQLAFDLGSSAGELALRMVGLSLDSDDQDSYPDGHKLNRKRQYLGPSLRWRPRTGTTLTLFGEYLKNDSAEDPYYLNIGGLYTPIKMGDYSFSRIRQEQGALGYLLDAQLDANWSLVQAVRHSRITLDRRAVWIDALDADGRTLHRSARSWNDPLSQSAVDTALRGRVQTGAVSHTLLMGFDWNDQRIRARRFIGAAPDLDLYLPIYNQLVAMPQTPVARGHQRTIQSGVYLQDQLRWGERWVLTLGARRDDVKSEVDDVLEGTQLHQRDRAVSRRVGLNYLLGNGWSVYASHAESFLPNSGLDAQGDPFKPSRGAQLELGTRYQPEGRGFLFAAAVFDLRKTNVVSYDPVSFEGLQVGRQRSKGLELEAKGTLRRGLNISAAYTWLDTKVTQSADAQEIGKSPPGIPRHSASVWLDWRMKDGWGGGAGLRYVGRRANDEHNSSFVGGVALMDAAIRYETGPWRFALNVSNLFDKKYFSICYHAECYRGAERAATLSARYSF